MRETSILFFAFVFIVSYFFLISLLVTATVTQESHFLNNPLDLEEPSDVVDLPRTERKDEDQLEGKPVEHLLVGPIIDCNNPTYKKKKD